MAFKFSPDPTFPLEVAIRKPGGYTDTLKLHAKHMGRKAFVEYCKSGEGKLHADFIGGFITGWDEEKEFSQAALAELLENFPLAPDDIFIAYREALLGAERKN